MLGLSVGVHFPYSVTSRNQVYKQQYQQIQHDTDMEYKEGFFLKTLRSEVMASFVYHDSVWHHSNAFVLAFSMTKYSKSCS